MFDGARVSGPVFPPADASVRARLACPVGYSDFVAPVLLAFAFPPLLAGDEGALDLPATLVLPVFAAEVLREGAFFAAALPAVADFAAGFADFAAVLRVRFLGSGPT